MAEQNLVFNICNEDGTSFNDIAIKSSTYTETVMSLDNNIEGFEICQEKFCEKIQCSALGAATDSGFTLCCRCAFAYHWGARTAIGA